MCLNSCLDDFNVPPCMWFPNGEYRNALISVIAGILFFMGWWFIIDVQVTCSDDFKGPYHLCGILGTVSLFMVNSISNSVIQDNGENSACGARVWLFLGFVIGFASVIAACWILFANFLLYHPSGGEKMISVWVGCGLFLQNCFIFISSLVYKFGRTEEHFFN